ncbi:hypothetical protein GALL_06900 [mine drainage metagenome]|uniref:Uncharacterized protein n=1 Tax=mine drainage metagenome TaxID=410659 RepID=A0A1J5U6A3_9ZZZZ
MHTAIRQILSASLLAMIAICSIGMESAQAACAAGTGAPTIRNPPTIVTPMNTGFTMQLDVPQNSVPPFTFAALDQSGTQGFGITGSSAKGGAVTIMDATLGRFSYVPPTGYFGNDFITISVAPTCDPTLITIVRIAVTIGSNIQGTYVSCAASSSCMTGSIGGPGGSVIIIDNTPNPGSPGIVTNMATNAASVMKGLGEGNEIEVKLGGEIQVMQRDANVNPHDLIDEIGSNNANSTSYQNFYSGKRITYFANGTQLFDLDKMRRAAEWESGNIPPSAAGKTCTYPTLPGGTYRAYKGAFPRNNGANAIPNDADGTPVPGPAGNCHFTARYSIDPAIIGGGGNYGAISWAQFVYNVANNITMYGIVRVLIPAEAGTATARTNALGAYPLPGITGVPDPIYGQCKTTTTRTLCLNPPTGAGIQPGASITLTDWNGAKTTYVIPKTAQVRVRGSLFFDFVDGQKNYPAGIVPGIGLGQLPSGKELKFNMWMPISVNAANDRDGDGIMDNLEYIESVSAGVICSNAAGPSFPCSYRFKSTDISIDPNQVPQEAVDSYNAQFNKKYRDSSDPAFVAMFGKLNLPNQYHLLMPSAYAQGWADAFAELNIGATQWSSLGFLVPAQHAAPLTVAEIRGSGFEDLPVYLYSGGTADLGNHINISGLMYIPQSIELEVSGGNNVAFTGTRQFVMGGLIVRDGFELESKQNSNQTISSDPLSFATARVNPNTLTSSVLTTVTRSLHGNNNSGIGVGVGGGAVPPTPGGPGDTSCVGCSGTVGNPGKVRWVEVRPQ